MTDVLTVPTHFGDLSELSEGLVDRVGDGSLILYGPSAYEQGSVVNFRILLADDTTALEGHGRINDVYDGGEEREPETRYDIVFDALELDGRNEVVYERIVLARESMVGDVPHTGEVDISQIEDDVAAVEVSADEAAYEDLDAAVDVAIDAPTDGAPEVFGEMEYEPLAAEQQLDEQAPEFAQDAFDQVEDAGSFEEFHEPPATPSANPMEIIATSGPLGRPTFAASWSPTAPAPEPRPSSGWFLYPAGTLPGPERAPRPELSPELRVAPAPRPTEESLAAAAAAQAPPPSPPSPPAAPVEEFDEMPLPDDDAEIAPAVEAEYVSVGDANPSDDESLDAAAQNGEASADDELSMDEFEGDDEDGFDGSLEDGGFEDFGDVELDEA